MTVETHDFSFNTYSGSDIVPMFNGQAIGSIQAISYSVQREKAAIYTMGKAGPRGFTRGKRAIAGSLVFILFDRNALIEHFKTSKFSADRNERTIDGRGADVEAGSEMKNGNIDYNQVVETPWYVDQIPPFDIIIAAANEYGSRSYLKIVGVELLNENSGFSIDDIVVEQQYTFVATDVRSWKQDGRTEMIK